MAFTLAQLDAVEAAIASGTLTVHYSDKSVTYKSTADMIMARQIIRRALGLAGQSTTVVIAHDRGT